MVRRLEGQPADRGEVEARRRRGDALGPAQRIGDRDAHVGLAELGEHRAVAERDQAVHDRFRMDQDLDPVLAEAEQVVGLDQLEALVHHGRRIDRDLGAHVPVGVSDRLARRDARPSRRAGGRGTARRRRSGSAARRSRRPRRAAPGRSRCARNRPAAARRRCAPPRPSAARRRRPGIPWSRARPSRRAAPRRASGRGRRRRRSPPSPSRPAAPRPRPGRRRRPRPRCRCRRALPSGRGSRRGRRSRRSARGGGRAAAARRSTLRCAVSASTR